MALLPMLRGLLSSTAATPVAQASAAPIRESSPESDGAAATEGMYTRSPDSSWFPKGFVVSNEDSILARQSHGEGMKLYDQLLDDDVAFSTMQQRRLAITSRDWEVTPGDPDDPRSVQAADDFRDMLAGLAFDDVTGKLHFGVWYGYAIGEAIWTTKPHNGRTIIWLDNIVVPDRRWFGFTAEGELRFTGDWLSAGGEVVPDNKFVTIRTGASHDFAFYGLGLAHWCYYPIFFKRSALKFWALYLEKFGRPTVAFELDQAEINDEKAKQLKIAAGIAIGQDSVVLVPAGTLSADKMQLIEAERSGAGASSYDEFVKAQDEALMRVILGQPGTSKGVSSGLNSDQASEHSDVKAEIVKADSDLISDALNRTYAKWVTLWNYGPDVAPPKVFRVLDDPEDLNTTAERDVELAGIGITRTEDSVKQVYGDGYEYEKPPSLAEQAQMKVDALKAAPGAPANNNQPPKSRAAAFAAEFGVEDEAPLYVRRDLLNTGDLIAWAKAQGIGSVVPDLHVTVLYSKKPVDWFQMGDSWATPDDGGKMRVNPGGPRSVELFGHDPNEPGPLVLRFASSDLSWRHASMVERGASDDYDEYKPHVTISYDPGDINLDAIEPYTGELRFGPEIFEPIKPSAPFSDPALLNFSADEDAAIDRLVSALVADADPVFSAIAEELQTNLQGVRTLEGARVAMLTAFERLPYEKLAKLTGLPMLAERAAAVAGVEGEVDA